MKIKPTKEPLEDENEVNWNIPYIPQQNFMEMEFGN
jgi:hypothetical protein